MDFPPPSRGDPQQIDRTGRANRQGRADGAGRLPEGHVKRIYTSAFGTASRPAAGLTLALICSIIKAKDHMGKEAGVFLLALFGAAGGSAQIRRGVSVVSITITVRGGEVRRRGDRGI